MPPLAKGPFPGDIFGDLVILYEMEKTNPKRHYFWCRDINTRREGRVERGSLMNGRTNNGRLFPIRCYKDCNNLEDYINQFIWSISAKGRYRTKHKVFTGYRSVLVWKTLYGEIPKGYEVDHIDRDRTNDVPSNLRLLTRAQNQLNTKPESTRVYYEPGLKRGKPYYIRPLGKKRYYFETEKEAMMGYNIYMTYHAPKELREEHDLPGNTAGRFIPILNDVR